MIVVNIVAQKNPYYLTKKGRWAAALGKALQFATLEEASEEAARRGVVNFLGEACEAEVSTVEQLTRPKRKP